jgi:hypothetical protein
MLNYSLVLLVVVIAIVQRSPRVLLHGAIAVLLGAALAAFYIFPAAYEEKWVNIAEVLSPGVRPQDNFLFTIIADPDHNRFNFLVSLVAFAQIAIVAGAAWLSRFAAPKGAPESSDSAASLKRCPDTNQIVRRTLSAWAAAAMLLMFSITSLAWELLPKLRFVQLPWRWLLCLNIAFAMLVTMAWRRWFARFAICVTMLAVVGFVWHRVQTPWWDAATDVAAMQNSIFSGKGYEGTDEYVPAGADPYEIKQDARHVSYEGEGTARIHVLAWDPESKTFEATVSRPGRLVLRLFNFPAWQVRVNGQVVSAETQDVTGQMLIPVAFGENKVEVMFIRTWDRTAGGVVSGITAVGLIGFAFSRRRVAHP